MNTQYPVPSTQSPIPNTKSPIPNTQPPVPNILLVDDEISILKSIGPFLESLGYHVTTAESGEDAIELLNRSTFDLVITDLIMGNVDGFQVVETGKNLRSETMFIILTGRNDATFIVNALRLGADDYLIKPCEPEELRFRVEHCLEKLESKKKAKQAEEALRKSEERYRSFFNASPVSLWEEDYSAVIEYMKDLHDSGVKDMRSYFDDHPEEIAKCAGLARILDVNPATLQIYEAQNREDLLENLNDVFTEDSLEIFKEQLITFFEGGFEFRSEGITQTLTGKKNYVQLMVSLLSEYRVLVLITDITDKKKMQEELLKAKMLESLGVLAGGIAHDFNNLMSAVLGYISLAGMEVEQGSKAFKLLFEAEKASVQTKELTARLITFSEGGGPVKETASICHLIKDSVDSLLKDSDVSCKISISDHISPVEIDEEQIKQVIRNIITNAKESMAEQGTINVSCENVNTGEKDTLTLKDGKYVRISIEDQGPGIPEEDLIKIFDPYFSTKDVGNQKGVGLGLAVSDSIVKQHDGLITVKSELGAGSTFSIYVPASEKEIVEVSPVKKPVSEKPVTQGEKILVMDDEEMVRDVSNALLTHLGYEVEVAVDGVEAIELYKKAMESEKPFDMVILDLTNKVGMGGAETIVRLLEIDPDVKAIVASGYSNDPIMSDFREHGFCGALPKPFTLDQLKTALHDAIAGE